MIALEINTKFGFLWLHNNIQNVSYDSNRNKYDNIQIILG